MKKLTGICCPALKRLGLTLAVAWIGVAFLPPTAYSQPDDGQNLILGKVVKIYDGDTIAIKGDKGKMIRVQVAYIDAPDMDEKTAQKQPIYGESIKALSDMIFNKEVIIESFGIDKHGRVEGMIFLEQMNVNVEMVRRGMAEIYDPVRSNPSGFKKEYVKQLFDAENAAKGEKLGIWGHPDYISPYKFRRRADQ
jgi:endonuclease YncB( thermonuclease family)